MPLSACYLHFCLNSPLHCANKCTNVNISKQHNQRNCFSYANQKFLIVGEQVCRLSGLICTSRRAFWKRLSIVQLKVMNKLQPQKQHEEVPRATLKYPADKCSKSICIFLQAISLLFLSASSDLHSFIFTLLGCLSRWLARVFNMRPTAAKPAWLVVSVSILHVSGIYWIHLSVAAGAQVAVNLQSEVLCQDTAPLRVRILEQLPEWWA